MTLRGTTKLQDLVYTYDPVGNILAVRNNADNAPFFSGATVVSGDGLYEYDAIYRLTSATGREHPGTQPVDADPPIGTALPHSNDLEALLLYTETYSYDDVGNIKQLQHSAGNGGTNGWTRNYNYLQSGTQSNNQLQKTSVPGTPGDLSLTYTYDAHGSMITMPHLQVMEWVKLPRLGGQI